MKLNKELILKASALMDRHPKYSVAEKVVLLVFSSHSENKNMGDVLLKVAVLNSLYATNVFDLISIAKHIITINNLDQRLGRGDITAVDSIRKGHGIILKKSSAERDFYSFATKYCSFRNPTAYPIYDNLVSNFLYKYNKKHNCISNLKKEQLKDYSIYKKLLDAVLMQLGLVKEGYKLADKGLWICAKYYYRNRKQISDAWINDKMQDIVKRH